MQTAEELRTPRYHENLFEPGFAQGLLDTRFKSWGGEGSGPTCGYTTHLSVVDEHGNAVALTSSLGETSGEVVPGTGILLNNFLGEEDVNPAGGDPEPGQRLMTMCCPTMMERNERIYVMGSGGSSRIRSAVLHGIYYLVDHHLEPQEVVRAPRCHLEGGALHLETPGRPIGTLEELSKSVSDIRSFDGPSVFFGGLHLSSVRDGLFSGGGDARRSGYFATTDEL
jgi:gamma-glutamyltranspeptidase/glutathione hydrolase